VSSRQSRTTTQNWNQLLQKWESADPNQVPGLLKQVTELLIPHSQAEEQVVYAAIKSGVPEGTRLTE
jgi:hemerythrin superfamily protein